MNERERMRDNLREREREREQVRKREREKENTHIHLYSELVNMTRFVLAEDPQSAYPIPKLLGGGGRRETRDEKCASTNCA